MEQFKNAATILKQFLLPILVGLATAAIVILVLIPQLGQYLEDKNKIEELKQKTAAAENKAIELEKIDQELLTDQLKVTFTVLPPQANILEAISTLEQTATQSGVILDSISYTPSAKGGSASFTLTGEIQGPIRAVDQFLTNAHNSPRIMEIESVEVQVDGSSLGVGNAEIPLIIYYKPTSPKTPDLGQPVPKLTSDDEQLLQRLSEALARSPRSVILEDTSSIPLGKEDPFQ